jgi:cytochrome c oxidase subunit 2
MLDSLPLIAQTGSWLPEKASTAADHVDWVFSLITVICVVFGVGIFGALVTFVVKYRRRSDVPAARVTHHNNWLEIAWSVIPAILLAVIFVSGLTGFMQMAEPPNGAYEIKVTGKKWVWAFQYPNGYIDDTLHVPVDRPVVLTMTSDDVIHSMYIPAFRVKRDVIPGRYTKLWFEPTEPGEYNLFCAEYCGTKHSDMITTVVVHPPGEYERWLEKASNFLETMTPAEAGKTLYRRRGCAQCHSLDGSKMVGPTFYQSFGATAGMDDGSSITIDENYIRESILEPQAKARAGYRKVMPTYQGQLKDAEIDALIEYIKTLK